MLSDHYIIYHRVYQRLIQNWDSCIKRRSDKRNGRYITLDCWLYWFAFDSRWIMQRESSVEFMRNLKRTLNNELLGSSSQRTSIEWKALGQHTTENQEKFYGCAQLIELRASKIKCVNSNSEMVTVVHRQTHNSIQFEGGTSIHQSECER